MSNRKHTQLDYSDSDFEDPQPLFSAETEEFVLVNLLHFAG